jgi:DDE superfamily endonuclease
MAHGMVRAALRAVGLSHRSRFRTAHRVLNRGVWSSRGASRIVLGVLGGPLVPTGPLVRGIDATIARRRGKKITAAGI